MTGFCVVCKDKKDLFLFGFYRHSSRGCCTHPKGAAASFLYIKSVIQLAAAASMAQYSVSDSMPYKHTRIQPETNSLSARNALVFQMPEKFSANTITPVPPTDSKKPHCSAVPAIYFHAAMPGQHGYCRSRDNKNVSHYKTYRLERNCPQCKIFLSGSKAH